MLVLTRKTNETIVIEGPCEITLLSISGNRASVGIKADRDINIRRGEIDPLDKKASEAEVRP